MASMPANERDRRGLDPSARERLRRQGGPELVKALFESFRTRTPRRLAEARAALAEGRPETARIVVHTLRSSSALIGATELEAVAREAEERARLDPAADLAPYIERLEAAFAALAPELARGEPE